MFFRSRCYNGGKQHRFEARYSEKEFDNPATKVDIPYSPLTAPGVVVKGEALRRQKVFDVYVHDICVWCGEMRKQAPSPAVIERTAKAMAEARNMVWDYVVGNERQVFYAMAHAAFAEVIKS